jgi:anaerobic magnesium-protoporphyrin IX monomethyl ester cyclase
MRILLIDPPTNVFTGLIKRGYPIGLCMLAAVAKQEGVEDVRVYDADKTGRAPGGLNFTDQRRNMALFLDGVNDKNHPVWQALRNRLDTLQPDIVGISTMTIQYASALRTAEIVKTWNKNCLTIMGGAHASVMPRTMIDWPYTDAVVRGEGEDAFREILRRVAAGDYEFDSIPGVITRKSNEGKLNTYAEVADLDTLPFPDRSALIDQSHYLPEDMGLMLTSRGCPFRCTYCSNFTVRTRYRSVEHVLAEVALVQRTFGTTQFRFKDDSFTVSRKRITELCHTILNRKMKFLWESSTRLDLIDDELIRLMKRAGCNLVAVGVESGDDQMLEIYEKRLNREQIRKGTRILNRNRIFWTAYFMMGLPMEREEQINRTLTFMRELKPPYAALGVYKPYPGTKLFGHAEELGLVDARVPNDYFFNTNPVDYFLKDPHRRCVHIPHERLSTLTTEMMTAFDAWNKRLSNLLRRATARKALYMKQPKCFLIDAGRVIKWFRSSVGG